MLLLFVSFPGLFSPYAFHATMTPLSSFQPPLNKVSVAGFFFPDLSFWKELFTFLPYPTQLYLLLHQVPTRDLSSASNCFLTPDARSPCIFSDTVQQCIKSWLEDPVEEMRACNISPDQVTSCYYFLLQHIVWEKWFTLHNTRCTLI